MDTPEGSHASNPGETRFFRSLTRIFLSFHRLKHILADTTNGAYPIIRNIFKCRARLNAMFRIAYCGVINPIAYCAYILFHLQITFNS